MAGPDDDRGLIERAQQGDRQAFETLLRRYYDVIYRIAYRWCGSKADAEDITQTACIKLARAIGSYRFRSGFLTWLYPLVINTAKDWAKSRARQTAPLEEADGHATAADGEDRVYAGQVMDFIRLLPERERDAIYLVLGEGLSHREAASVMSCKESTVSWYIHEARKKLQSLRNMECRYG